MAEAIWTSVAEADWEDILFYIAVQDGRPETAERINNEIRNKLALYAEYPELAK